MRLTALSRIAQMSEEEVLARLETLPEYNDLPDGGAAVREYWQEFLNRPQAEVVIADDLTEDEKKQFIIKDNVNYGDWDYDELENWDSAKLEDWGVDLIPPDFGGEGSPTGGSTEESDGDTTPVNNNNNFKYESQYGVIVMCSSEEEQEQIYNRLTGEGFTCKVVSV